MTINKNTVRGFDMMILQIQGAKVRLERCRCEADPLELIYMLRQLNYSLIELKLGFLSHREKVFAASSLAPDD